MDAGKRKELIAQYNDGYRVVAEALVGAPDEELDARPAPGKWSAREVVHHLADSEMTAATRLFYDRPIEASLDAFKTARRSTSEILARMTDAHWARAAGTHTEHGAYTAERWLEIYAGHAHAHAEQILVARDAARQKAAGS